MHKRDLFLRVVADICSLRKAPADHFVVVFTVGLLIRSVRIAVEHTGPCISLSVAFDRPRVGELTAVVRKKDGKEIHKNIRSEFQIQPFKDVNDRL